ncbi:MAG TPA: alkaline phosphatase family protein [Baekduia sp.]|nr:alkaline phosphatase family protein [Baekduia sp.]
MPCSDDDGVGPGLPGPRVAAALVLGVLAFGVVVGNAVGPGTTAAGAGGRANVTILVAAAPTTPAPVVAPASAVTTTPQLPDDTGDSTALDDVSVSDDTGLDDTSTDTTSTDPGATDDTPADDGATDDPSIADGTTNDSATTPAPKLPPVKHVWVVALTGHSYDESFGAAAGAGSYLSTELRAKGTLLTWYHAAGHDPSAGGVALLSGQRDALGPFDDKTVTLADQLTGAGHTWKAYVEGATEGLNAGDNPCLRPPEQQPRNPFLRFASITGAAECGSSIAELDRIAPDAADSDSAPAFSYILPGPTHDGSTSLADADAWLRTTLPAILDSKAYNDGGLVVVTFDAGAAGDLEAGGGRVGALLLSPYVTAGATIGAPHDPFSLLASIEGLFGLDPIGYAKTTKLKPFGPKVYAAWSATTDAG